jgi:hypothetical protein
MELLALNASNYIYGVAYTLQFIGVMLTVAGLWSVRTRFRSELDALWESTPDPVASWIVSRRQAMRVAANAALVKLHLRHRTVVQPSAHDSFQMSDSATAHAIAGSPPRFDPDAELGPQFDALADLIRTTRQTVMDLDHRLQEKLNSERRERTEVIKQLDDKVRAVSFGGFGWAVIGAALLVISVLLEIAANFA